MGALDDKCETVSSMCLFFPFLIANKAHLFELNMN